MQDKGLYDITHIEAADNKNGIEFEKLRFEYAWRHFEMHARQRIQMFNFFIIGIAFLGGAMSSIANSQNPLIFGMAPFFAIFGMFFSGVFLALDIRNRQLYSLSRESLRALERNILYPTNFRVIYANPETATNRFSGIMTRDSEGFFLFRHKYLIPLCHVASFVAFLLFVLRLHQKI